MSTTSEEALRAAWHQDSARTSLEHWDELCEREGWGECPRNRADLIGVFGASWYLTRLIFYRGRDAARLIDEGGLPDCTLENLDERIAGSLPDSDLEATLEVLRIFKNETMLRLLVAWLNDRLSLPALEQALSNLAEAVMHAVIRRIGLDDIGDGIEFAVLGMGRLAGAEMIFGSDLDLIFLYGSDGEADTSRAYPLVRSLLRNIASVTAAGNLYDVDMRLRPHGTAGPLITSASAFTEHHLPQREIWERQMMTRCRPVFDPAGLARDCLGDIEHSLYGEYDPEQLRTAIIDMRMRVQRELGSPRDKYEVKRGRGGLMDVDFVSHYLQLLHGHAHPDLRLCSTRAALRKLEEKGLLEGAAGGALLSGYDYLKKLECCLRLFDMKSISAFAREGEQPEALARAMQPGGDADGFIPEFLGVTESVRAAFNQVLGVESPDE